MVRIVARRLAIFIVLSLLALGAATSRAQIDPGAPPEILWTLPISAMPYTAACDDTGNLFVGGVDVARGWHDGSALLKFSPNGHQAWSIPLPSGTFVRSVRIDPAGQVVVLGQVFTNRYRFGATRVSTGARSGFYIARFTGDGRLLSVRAAGGFFTAERMALDGRGNAYVVGNITAPLVSFCGTPVFFHDKRFFLAKFSAAGAFCWVQPLGSINYGRGVDLGVDPSGNAYVAGTLVGSGLFAGKGVRARSGYNAFVAKYDTYGRLKWMQQVDGSTNGEQFVHTLSVDGTNGCYVTGIFHNQSMGFGDISVVSTNGGNGNTMDIFLARFSPSGQVLWAKSAGGVGDDRPTFVSVAPNGDLLLPGYVIGGALFDSVALPDFCQPENWPWGCSMTGFLARYSRSGDIRWVLSTQGPGRFYSVYGTGNGAAGHCYLFGDGIMGFFIARLADWPGTNAPSAVSLVPPAPAE